MTLYYKRNDIAYPLPRYYFAYITNVTRRQLHFTGDSYRQIVEDMIDNLFSDSDTSDFEIYHSVLPFLSVGVQNAAKMMEHVIKNDNYGSDIDIDFLRGLWLDGIHEELNRLSEETLLQIIGALKYDNYHDYMPMDSGEVPSWYFELVRDSDEKISEFLKPYYNYNKSFYDKKDNSIYCVFDIPGLNNPFEVDIELPYSYTNSTKEELHSKKVVKYLCDEAVYEFKELSYDDFY